MIREGAGAPPYTQRQRREAAEWFVAIRAEHDPNAEAIQAWLRWMDEEEGNRAAFDATARAWHAASSLSGLSMPDADALAADEYSGEESVEEWLSRAAANTAPERVMPVKARPRMTRRKWLAAACMAIAVPALLTIVKLGDRPADVQDEFVTRIGEKMEITLGDGSHIWLGPKSELRVRFDEEVRRIVLTTGEAYFDVKKDRRPFRVSAGGGDIVAVGTAFNVRALDEQVIVDVSEGAVAVMPQTQSANRGSQSVRVASGQKVTFSAQQPAALAVVQSQAPVERARWRDGLLVYRNEPLQAVISDIVRYSDIRIEIADAHVGDLHYTGVIYHDALHEWVSALPESFPVTVVSDGSREIIRAR